MSGVDPSVWLLIAKYRAAKHRRAQEAIADTVQRDVARAWRDVSFSNLDQTNVPFLARTLPKVESAYEKSQAESMKAMHLLRQLAEHQSEDPPLAPEVLELARPARSGPVDMSMVSHLLTPFNPTRTGIGMSAAGVGRVKAAMPAREVDAMAKGLRGAAGVAVMAAVDGGRQLVRDLSNQDDLAIGWQRMTDMDPCYFCALLAANGPYYKGRTSFARSNSEQHMTRTGRSVKFSPNLAFELTGEPEGIAKVHDNCRCTLVPVFEGAEFDDEWGKVALDLYEKVTDDGYSGKRALNTYRRRYNSYRTTQKDLGSTLNQDVNATQVAQEIENALRLVPASSNTARFLRLQASSL